MSNKSIEALSQELFAMVTELCATFYDDANVKSQIKRACLSIGANKAEAKYAESSLDFVHKLSISLKECAETKYWLKTLYVVESVPKDKLKKAINKCGSIERKLVASIKKVKEKLI